MPTVGPFHARAVKVENVSFRMTKPFPVMAVLTAIQDIIVESHVPTIALIVHNIFFENKDRTCYICKNGFYNGRYRDTIDPPLKDCSLSCRDNCEICTSYVNCKLCKTGHYLSSEKECKKCPKYCANCSSATHCLQCEDRYFKDNEACQECSPGCKTCLSQSHCTSCDDGFFLQRNKCKQCMSVCINCLSGIYCQFGANGYWGTMCENSCTWNCRHNICDIHNGTCIHGLTDDSRKTKEEGYFGNTAVGCPDGKYLAIIIVLGSALGLILVLIIVWKISCRFYRRQDKL